MYTALIDTCYGQPMLWFSRILCRLFGLCLIIKIVPSDYSVSYCCRLFSTIVVKVMAPWRCNIKRLDFLGEMLGFENFNGVLLCFR